MLKSIYNLLTFVEQNWTLIAAIITICAAIYKKIESYLSKTQEERLEIAKAQIKETMLKWVTLAECDWKEWQKSGGIKRSQVIDQIFTQYPILSTVTDQTEIIVWIDNTINDALDEMRKIFEENTRSVEVPLSES